MSFWMFPCSDVQGAIFPWLLHADAIAMACACRGTYQSARLRRAGIVRAADPGAVRCKRPCHREGCYGGIGMQKGSCARSDGHLNRCLCKTCFHILGILPEDGSAWCKYCYTRIRGIVTYGKHGDALHFGCWLACRPPPDGLVARAFM